MSSVRNWFEIFPQVDIFFSKIVSELANSGFVKQKVSLENKLSDFGIKGGFTQFVLRSHDKEDSVTDILISLAKAAILVALNQPDTFDLDYALKTFPALQENAAVFITLTTEPNNQLRGCIGSLQAYRPLYKDIIANAQAAALRDSRFTPITLEELNSTKIEVSILSEPKILEYRDIDDLKNKITPLQDGIILKYQGYQATYLPQVWEDLPLFDTFFSSLCQKANLASNCLSKHPEILTYRVTKYKEE